MKKKIALTLAALLAVSSFAACGGKTEETTAGTTATGTAAATTGANGETDATTTAAADGDTTLPDVLRPDATKLYVITSYNGTGDGTEQYREARDAWDAKSDLTVVDNSITVDSGTKAIVAYDFTLGAEADVYFFLLGGEIKSFADKLVPVSDIKSYDDTYGDNIKDSMLPVSPDGNRYGLPMYGYWEGMFTNKSVVEEAGGTVPTATTTWAEFETLCKAIIAVKKTPIGASLKEIPHYWFEFAILNQESDPAAQHAALPASATDDAGKRWVAAFDSVATMAKDGFFGSTWATVDDATAKGAVQSNSAAFYIDGSWARKGFEDSAAGQAGNMTVTFVPATDVGRKPTDIIGGLSSGWFITKKAWNSTKKDAAIDFVKYMTSDDVVKTYTNAQGTANPFVDSTLLAPGDDASQLLKDAVAMLAEATSVQSAVQDTLSTSQSKYILGGGGMLKVAQGDMTAAAMLEAALKE